MNVLRTVWWVLSKDVLVELRTREALGSMVLFAILVVVVFAFAFDLDETRARLVAPGILWVTVLFAGTVGIGRVFDRERECGCMTPLLLAPGGASALFLAKALGTFLFILLSEVIIFPLAMAFLGVAVSADGVRTLALALTLGTVGFVLVGTLCGAMLAQSRLRDVLLPVVLYPIVIPVVIAGVQITEQALGSGMSEDAVGWLQLMMGFDLIFAALCPWVFTRVMVE